MSGVAPLRLEVARERMLHGLAPLPAEEVPVGDARGRVLATDVFARVTLPPWDNSAMDGFAVQAGDLTGAGRRPRSSSGSWVSRRPGTHRTRR